MFRLIQFSVASNESGDGQKLIVVGSERMRYKSSRSSGVRCLSISLFVSTTIISVFVKMSPKLRCLVHRGVGPRLRAAHRHVRATEEIAQRADQSRVGRK